MISYGPALSSSPISATGTLTLTSRGSSVRIVIDASAARPTRLVDAVVAEEDTFLVLSAGPEPKETHEQPERLLAQAREVEPATPGTVLVRGDSPLQFLAIVHDLNEEPSWKEAWVESALREIFLKAEDLQLESIALPLLGAVHGALEPKRFAELLREALHNTSLANLSTIRLMAPQESATEVALTLRDFHCEME